MIDVRALDQRPSTGFGVELALRLDSPRRDDGERTTRIANATRDAFTVRRRTRL